jgi:hypothetical protein
MRASSAPIGAPGTGRSGKRPRAFLQNVALVRVLYARAGGGASPRLRAIRSARPLARRSPPRDGGGLPFTRPRDSRSLSARPRRKVVYSGRAPPWPDARLRRHRSKGAAPDEWAAEELAEPRLLELIRDGSPTMRGRTRNGTCGGPRRCGWQAGSSPAPRRLAEVDQLRQGDRARPVRTPRPCLRRRPAGPTPAGSAP